MADTRAMDLAPARQRLQQANGGRLSESDLDALAPQMAELAAGLAALEQHLAPEAEPATIERVTETGQAVEDES